MKRLYIALSFVLIGLLAGLSLPGSADDTEIYLRPIKQDPSSRPNILFALDNGASMNTLMEDGSGLARIDVLKQAVIQVLADVHDVNVGVERFLKGSSGSNAAIMYPIRYIDDPHYDGLAGSGSGQTVYVKAGSGTDDGVEDLSGSGEVSLADMEISLNARPGVSGSAFSVTKTIAAAADNAVEFLGDGVGASKVAATNTFYDLDGGAFFLGNHKCASASDCRGGLLAGVRFASLAIPQNTAIQDARLQFTLAGSSALVNGDKPVTLRIYVQTDAENKLPVFDGGVWTGTGEPATSKFTDTADLSAGRTWSSGYVEWSIPAYSADVGDGTKLTTPDLSALIKPLVDSRTVNTLIFKLAKVSGDGVRQIYDRNDVDADGKNRGPTLLINQASEGKPQAVALRFPNVPVPSGVIISSAKILFTAGTHDATNAHMSADVTVKIDAEAVGDSPALTSDALNISGRTTLVESGSVASPVSWAISGAWATNSAQQSPELKALVQELVKPANNWCGNSSALTFIISPADNADTDFRKFFAYEGGTESVRPVLSIEYDPDTIPANSCFESVWSKEVTSGNDDAEQPLTIDGTANSSVFLSEGWLELGKETGGNQGTDERLVGLRFQYAPIPTGATIVSAHLEFMAADPSGQAEESNAILKITGQKPTAEVPDALRFQATTANDLSSTTLRPRTSAGLTWTPGPWSKGGNYTTKTDKDGNALDLKNVIQEIVDADNWENNDDIVLFLANDGGSGWRKAYSFEDFALAGQNTSVKPPKLVVRYRGAPGADSQTVRTYLQEMVRNMFVSPEAERPIDDAMGAAALYFTGSRTERGEARDRTYEAVSYASGDYEASPVPSLYADEAAAIAAGWTKLSDTQWASPADSHNQVVHFTSGACDVGPPSGDQRLAKCDRRSPLYWTQECADLFTKSTKCANSSSQSAKYISPIKAGACNPTNHVILVTDGEATHASNMTESLIWGSNTTRAAADYGPGEINPFSVGDKYTCSPSKTYQIAATGGSFTTNNYTKCAPVLSEFLYHRDLAPFVGITPGTKKNNVKTHTIGFSLQNNQNAENFLRVVAERGGGDFYTANNVDELVYALKSIIAKAMVESTSFAAPTLSVNAFSKLFHNDEVYFSLFKPDYRKSWHGNVKKYKLCTGGGCSPLGAILDKDGNPAIVTEEGDDYDKIRDDAFNLWHTGKYTDANGTPLADGPRITQDGAGDMVVNYNSPGFTTPTPDDRKIYTSSKNAVTTTVDLDADNVSSADLGVADDAERDKLLAWIRGYETYDAATGTGTVREWLMGDPLHSSPVSMTYGKDSAGKDVTKVFIASNDGGLRMVRGDTGAEQWMFIPRELLGMQKDVRDNPPTDTEHTYGLDGNPSVLIRDKNQDGYIKPGEGDSVTMFIGMRRGGKNLYAVDLTPDAELVSNSTSFEPELKWVIKGGAGGTAGFEHLGQTWSMARPTKIYYGGQPKIVLMFGGGYDPVHDSEFVTSNQGNAIYMVDPDTGALLWSASSQANSVGSSLVLTGMDYPIPSTLAIFDSNGDGVTDRVYVGDMGGQLWRIDFGIKLGPSQGSGGGAAVGGILAKVSDPANVADQRRFFYPPDMAFVQDTQTSLDPIYDIVTITSGYRAHPLDTKIQDRFYAFRDRAAGGVFLTDNGSGMAKQDSANFLDEYTEANPATYRFFTLETEYLYNATSNILQELKDSADQANVVTLEANKEDLQKSLGWYIDLCDHDAGAECTDADYVGEKGLASPLIAGGKVFFTTYLPNAQTVGDVCQSLSIGKGRLYALDILSGAAALEQDNVTGLTSNDRSQDLGEGIYPDPQLVFLEGGTWSSDKPACDPSKEECDETPPSCDPATDPTCKPACDPATDPTCSGGTPGTERCTVLDAGTGGFGYALITGRHVSNPGLKACPVQVYWVQE